MRASFKRILKGIARRLQRLAVLCSLAALKLSAALGVFKPYQPIHDLNIRIRPNRERGVEARWAAIRNEPGAGFGFGYRLQRWILCH
jgi:hypothetical protein